MNQFYTQTDHFVLLPALMLALFGCAVLLFDFAVFKPRESRRYLPLFALAGLIFTGIALYKQGAYIAGVPTHEITGFRGSLVVDRFSLFFNWIFLAATALVFFVSYRWSRMSEAREGDHLGEWLGLILLAQSGMYFLATGIDLITLFVGLELMAVSFYVLVGFNRNERRSNEAAMKYLLLGSFSSGFLVYGMSLLYGISGSTKLRDIGVAIGERGAMDPIVLLASLHHCRRADVQGFRGPVPNVGARRIRRRANPDHGLFVGRLESRVVRFRDARLRRAVRPGPRGLGAAALRRRGAEPDRRQLRRDHAERTSSACWPIARSRTPAISCSAWWPGPRPDYGA